MSVVNGPRLTTDRDLRRALRRELVRSIDPDTLLLEELGLRHGSVRLDLAVLNGSLDGYELKSDRDTLARLPNQITMFDSVCDHITLVTSPRHLQKAFELLPRWWGVKVAIPRKCHLPLLCDLRAVSPNPRQEALAVAKLLWRDEVLGLLETAGVADGVRSKPRCVLYERLAQILDLPSLKNAVYTALKKRPSWSPALQQT
jgi:hypothetical protein